MAAFSAASNANRSELGGETSSDQQSSVYVAKDSRKRCYRRTYNLNMNQHIGQKSDIGSRDWWSKVKLSTYPSRTLYDAIPIPSSHQLAPEVDKVIIEIQMTTFTDCITRIPIPNIKLKVLPYDRITDPQAHMTAFFIAMGGGTASTM